MPDPVIWEDQRLPASYANFTSQTSMLLYQLIDVIKTKSIRNHPKCFPERKVVGIDSIEIIWD